MIEGAGETIPRLSFLKQCPGLVDKKTIITADAM